MLSCDTVVAVAAMSDGDGKVSLSDERLMPGERVDDLAGLKTAVLAHVEGEVGNSL